MMRTFKIYSFSNFQIYNTVLLAIVTMPYITSPGLTYFITGSLYLLTPFSHFMHPYPRLWQPQICSVYLWFQVFYFLVPHIDETYSYLSFSVWLISLSTQVPSMLSKMARIPFWGIVSYQRRKKTIINTVVSEKDSDKVHFLGADV